MPPVSRTMHALNEPPLEPLLLPLLDGLLPQAVRTRAMAATPVSATLARFICTERLPLQLGRDGRTGSGPGPDGPGPDPPGRCGSGQGRERAARLPVRPSLVAGPVHY